MTTQSPTEERKKKRLYGTVVRRAGEKTVVVSIVRETRDALYQKSITQTKNYLVHDAHDSAQEGDSVVIEESRPLSRRKRFIIVDQKKA